MKVKNERMLHTFLLKGLSKGAGTLFNIAGHPDVAWIELDL